MVAHYAGEANHCVTCGRWPCTWGLCQVCRDLYCTQDPESGKWLRPPWIRALLAIHRREQHRRRRELERRDISLGYFDEESWGVA